MLNLIMRDPRTSKCFYFKMTQEYGHGNIYPTVLKSGKIKIIHVQQTNSKSMPVQPQYATEQLQILKVYKV